MAVSNELDIGAYVGAFVWVSGGGPKNVLILPVTPSHCTCTLC